MKFLLSSKKNAASVAADPDKTEEFLLTVGLAYRDMATIHSGRDSLDPRPDPPEYMDINNTLLTQRVMDVCESVLILVCSETKLHKEKSKKVVAVNSHKVADTRSSSSDQDASRSSNTAGHSGASQVVRNGDTSMILPRPRPRKRPKSKTIGEFEEEEVRPSGS